MAFAGVAMAQKQEKPVSDPALQKELLELREKDQGALLAHLPEHELREIQHANQARLQEILRKRGWPSLSAVGNDAAQGAWLIVQHADDDLPWQREVLAMMQAKLPRGEARKQDIAYLSDRIAVNEHRQQTYGTQGRCVAKAEWKPFDMVDPEHVAERRAEMEMIPMENYLTMTAWMCRNWAAEKK
jgi:predicted amidohydrolase